MAPKAMKEGLAYLKVMEGFFILARAKVEGGRVIAVGTTAVRTLESASLGGNLRSQKSDTEIFIYPGFKFQVVDAMITNFHLPKSSLLMLVSAFIGWVPQVAVRKVANNLLTTAIERARKTIDKDNWSVVVTTAPRVDPTLSVCLDSLLIAGWNAKVFAEPGNYDYLNEEHSGNVVFNKTKRGVWWNWVDSCKWALENTTAENIMTVQDDSLFHPDSRIFVENFLWPRQDAGFVSLYTPKHYSVRGHLKSKPPRPLGLNRIVTKSLWGACALIFPRSVLEEMMENPFIENWRGANLRTKSAWEKKKKERGENPHLIANSDTAIGKMMNNMGKSMWFMDPSPVQHIAEHSAMGHGGNKGRRNCGRCAKYSTALKDQIPFHIQGIQPENLVEYKDLKKRQN